MRRRARWLAALGGTAALLALPGRPVSAEETWSLTGALLQSRCPVPLLNGRLALAGVMRAVREGETLTALGALATPAGEGSPRVTVTLRGVLRGEAFAGSVRFLGPGGMVGRGRAFGSLAPERVLIQFAGLAEERSGCDLSGELTGTVSR